jgi:photosystem I subunit 11
MNQLLKEKASNSSFDLISSFESDPFVGHLSTPITTSNFTKAYLSFLPIYQKNVSPLLAGINIGFVHAYFLFGPFLVLGPLRSSQVKAFAAFLSSTSLVIILSLALLIYAYASYKDEKKDEKSDGFSLTFWKNFTSGFIVGGFSGASFAYLLLKLFPFN